MEIQRVFVALMFIVYAQGPIRSCDTFGSHEFVTGCTRLLHERNVRFVYILVAWFVLDVTLWAVAYWRSSDRAADLKHPMARLPRRLIALVVLTPACLLFAELPASAASTRVLHYSGALSGTTVPDESGFGNNGTAHDVSLSGGAYSFNGTSSYIRTPASSTVNPGSAAFSYSVTVKLPTPTTFSRDLSLVRRGSSKFAGPYYKMEMVYNKATGNMRLECALRDAAGAHAIVSTSGNALNDGQWHTLTCSKSAKTISLTKDGHVRTKSVALGNLSSTRPLNFGAEQVGPTNFWEHFPGLMKKIVLTKRISWRRSSA